MEQVNGRILVANVDILQFVSKLCVVGILSCTDVAMRGLDFPSVTDVVMFDFPYDATTYIHRVGRTARAGSKGKITSFLTKKDRALFRQVQDRNHFNGALQKASGRKKKKSRKKVKRA